MAPLHSPPIAPQMQIQDSCPAVAAVALPARRASVQGSPAQACLHSSPLSALRPSACAAAALLPQLPLLRPARAA